MEFSNFYNIKTEQVGGWTPPPGPHVPERQKVNPFIQWAVASIPGIYFPGSAPPSDQTGMFSQGSGNILRVPTTLLLRPSLY